MVPRSAVVLRRGELTAVYVVPTTRAPPRLRQVRAGRGVADENGVEVLAGLRPGERVALDPVRAGMADSAGARP